MRSQSLLLYVTLGLLGANTPGCLLSVTGDGVGSVDGTLYVRGCRDGEDFGALGAPAAYSLDPTIYFADPIEDWVKHDNPVNRMQIRIQGTGNLPEEADILWITISDVADVARHFNQVINVDVSSNVRASLPLNRSCRDREATPILTGQIVFGVFGKALEQTEPERDFQVRYGEKVGAQFRFDVIDRRNQLLAGEGSVPATPAVGGELTGDFLFTVAPTRSGQAYP